MPKTLRQRIWFVAISLVIIAVIVSLYLAEDPPAAIVKIVWVPYALTWLIAISFFGGVHGAPAWSFIPAIAIAVFAQNLFLFWVGSWALKALRFLKKGRLKGND